MCSKLQIFGNLFKCEKDFLSLNPNIKTSLNVFDHTIKPILLYGSEIWGIVNLNNKKFKGTSGTHLSIDEYYKNFKGESLHLKFCKNVLGLNKKAVNHATLSELGRNPLHFDIIKALLKYLYRLENLSSEFPLLKDAFLCSKNLHYKGTSSWYSSAEKLLHVFDIKEDTFIYKKDKFGSTLIQSLKKKYSSDWKEVNEKLKDGKLVTYLSLKTHFGIEKYLNIVKYEYRKAICRFRVSSHRLMIETGRYNKIPRNDRLCKKCSENKIEDEIHFLLKCPLLNDKRAEIINLSNFKSKHYKQLSDSDKLIWILNNEDTDILNSVGKFLVDNMP